MFLSLLSASSTVHMQLGDFGSARSATHEGYQFAEQPRPMPQDAREFPSATMPLTQAGMQSERGGLADAALHAQSTVQDASTPQPASAPATRAASASTSSATDAEVQDSGEAMHYCIAICACDRIAAVRRVRSTEQDSFEQICTHKSGPMVAPGLVGCRHSRAWWQHHVTGAS